MRKKRANIFIETIVAVNIILMMFLIVSKLISANKESFVRRKEIEEANRVIYCIMQEIKYNMKIDYVIEWYENNNLKFENNENLLSNLFINYLSMVPMGNDIEIYIVDNRNDDEITLSIVLRNEKNNVIAERNFVKYRWTDYYEKL